jgi:hypothetical protein
MVEAESDFILKLTRVLFQRKAERTAIFKYFWD